MLELLTMKYSRPKIPPLKALPPFIAVARHLSFTKAADELCVTHSAVSQSIRGLEEFLGVKLFNRMPNKQITLTMQGERYFIEIHNAMDTIVAATERELGITTNNILTVNVLTTLTMHWLIPRIPLFQAKHPEIDLRLSSLGLEIDFMRDNIDISITYGHKEDWPDLYCKKLFDDELVIIGSNTLIPKTYQLKTLIKRLKAVYVDSDLRKQDWKQWCKKAKIPEPSKAKRIYFQNTSQALQAVASGVGIMVTHKPFIIDEIQSGRLKQIANTTLPLTKSYYLTCPKEKLTLKKVTNWNRWLLNEAKMARKNLEDFYDPMAFG